MTEYTNLLTAILHSAYPIDSESTLRLSIEKAIIK